jgi:hypothetical protein
MDNPAFHARFRRALEAGTLHASFTHIGDFSDATRLLHIRMLSAQSGGCWIVLERQA